MDEIIRRHKAQKQGRVYFTKETEKAIVSYNRSSDPEERSKLYEEKIHWAFYKLTENIIHTFKFYYTDGIENLEDLQHEIMVFLLSKIHKFDPTNGLNLKLKYYLFSYHNFFDYKLLTIF